MTCRTDRRVNLTGCLAAVLLGGLAVTSCGDPSSSGFQPSVQPSSTTMVVSDVPESPSVTSAPVLLSTDTSFALRVLDLNPITPAEKVDILQAYELSISKCATDRGVEYSPAKLPSAEDFARAKQLAYERELFTDADLVQQYLYHWPTALVVQRDARLDDPKNSELRSCAAEAFSALSIDGNLDGDPVLLLDALGIEYAEVNSQLDAERQAWGECMASKGYAGASMSAPPAAWATPQKVDSSLALADSGCRRSTGYADKKLELLRDWTAEFAMKHADDLTKLRSQIVAQVAAARRLLDIS